LSKEYVFKTLTNLGLKPLDSKVYLFLAKKGTSKGSDISKALKINRPQLYLSLKSLQSKGIVSSTLQRPAHFSAISFEELLDRFIKTMMSNALDLQQNRNKILSHWQSTQIAEKIDASSRFMVIEGRETIFSKVLQMITETKNRILAMTTVPGLIRADNFGLFDAGFEHPLRTKIRFRFITKLSDQYLKTMKKLLKRQSDLNVNFEGRDMDSDKKLFPRFFIRDDEEMILFITSSEDKGASKREVGLWTNSQTIIQAFNVVFEEFWQDSIDIFEKFIELETGNPSPKTCLFRTAEAARKKFLEILTSAKDEIMMLASSRCVNEIADGHYPLLESRGKGVKIRIMAPITNWNYVSAQKLSKYLEFRPVSSNYPRTTMVDGKHIFMFRMPQIGKTNMDASLYFENTFYSTDSEYVRIMKYMLNDVWKAACLLSNLTLESASRVPVPTVRPSDPVSEATKEMSLHDIGAVVIVENREPIGIITEKDIINRVINANRDPEKTPVNEIMSKQLITIDYKQTSQKALETMRANKVRRLVVVKGEKLFGLITERRVLRSCNLLAHSN
jgi:sugar-specific transcriptional regulator TrmB/CBS domain-containing protein